MLGSRLPSACRRAPESRTIVTANRNEPPAITFETLANGVRVIALPLPHAGSASVSVFVRTGSAHESPRQNGVSHLVEHMAFKGTETRDSHRLNLDAERLGAWMNAHTDKDHTAYHVHGLAEHAGVFIELLGDIVQHSTFPEDELERERGVILQELLEDEDDPVSIGFRLFDKACWGLHPAAQPVIGTRRNLQTLQSADLRAYVQRQYTGANVIVGVAGGVDADETVRAVEAAFAGLPRGEPHHVAAPAYVGGARSRRLSGSSQSHVVLGYPLPALGDDAHAVGTVAAALFGDGMSSPLLHTLRERLGLVYHAACSADVTSVGGQFVVEASTMPEQLDAVVAEIARLFAEHAEHAAPDVDWERARNQLAVRRLHVQERPFRALEEAAQSWFATGRPPATGDAAARVDAVDREAVRALFERYLQQGASLAVTGHAGSGAAARLAGLLAHRGAVAVG